MPRPRRIAWIALLVAVLVAALATFLMWAPREERGEPVTPEGTNATDVAVQPESPDVVAPEKHERVRVNPVEDAPPEHDVVTSEPQAATLPRVTVTVREEGGDVVPGATVEVRYDNPEYSFDPASWKWSARADADGVAKLELPRLGYYQARALHDGLSCSPASFSMNMRSRGIEVVIGPVVPVSGVVVSRNGAPVPDARVELKFRSDDGQEVRLSGDTDDRVRFNAGSVRETMLSGIRATASVGGRELVVREFARDQLTFPVSFVLRATAVRVTGRVIDEAGEPLAGVSVVPLVDGEPIRQTWSSTGSTGSFSFPLPAIDDLSRARISLPGRATAIVSIADTDDDGVVALGDVTLTTGGVVSGRVVREDGSAVADLWVALTPEELGSVIVHTETGPDGSFAIPCVGSGPHRVDLLDDEVLHLPGAPDRAIVHAGDEEVRLVYREPMLLNLRLIDGPPDWLPEEAEIAFLEPGSARRLAGRDIGGERSTVHLLVLGNGTFDVRVTVPGCEPCVLRDVRIGLPSPIELEARLVPAPD